MDESNDKKKLPSPKRGAFPTPKTEIKDAKAYDPFGGIDKEKKDNTTDSENEDVSVDGN